LSEASGGCARTIVTHRRMGGFEGVLFQQKQVRAYAFVTKYSSGSWHIASDSRVWRPRAGHGRKHDPGGEIVMRGDLTPNDPLRT
jgi:hypothetical protein